MTAQALTPATVNIMYNFGHEYLWHCHILSHEESDMMRPIVLNPNTKVDILWRNIRDGKNFAWFMDGIATVSQTLLPLEPDQNWNIVGRRDFNGDSKPDILWRNTLTGANRVWYMDGMVRIGEVPLLPTIPDLNWKIVN